MISPTSKDGFNERLEGPAEADFPPQQQGQYGAKECHGG
jgi:hypothetical protein